MSKTSGHEAEPSRQPSRLGRERAATAARRRASSRCIAACSRRPLDGSDRRCRATASSVCQDARQQRLEREPIRCRTGTDSAGSRRSRRFRSASSSTTRDGLLRAGQRRGARASGRRQSTICRMRPAASRERRAWSRSIGERVDRGRGRCAQHAERATFTLTTIADVTQHQRDPARTVRAAPISTT